MLTVQTGSGLWNRMPSLVVKRIVFVVTLMLLLVLMSGCADGLGRGVSVCTPWQPIYLASSDRLSEGTVRQIVAHNEVGERLCGWRPVGN